MNKGKGKRTFLLIAASLVLLAVLCLCVFSSLRDKWRGISFVVPTATGDETVSLYEDGDSFYAFLPSYTDMEALSLSVPEGCRLTLDDREYDGQPGFFGGISADTPMTMRMYSGLGVKLIERQLVIEKSENIPALYVTLIDGDLSSVNNSQDHSVDRAGRCALITADNEVDYSGKLDRLRGRGNVTWEENKKPYNIEFNEPADLLGMGKGYRYCLLANALDKSNLRDKIVYDAAIEAGLPNSAESAFVDLYIDGEYLGLYLMTEDVQLREDRVDLIDLEAQTQAVNPLTLSNYTAAESKENGADKRYFDIPNDPADITGGYLVELDMAERYKLFNSGFIFDGNDYCYTLKSPQHATKAEIDYISELFEEIEADFAAGKISERIDADSWARYFLVQEVFANFDPCSVYFYKDIDAWDEKIYAGPIWDFDKALGSPVYEGTGSPDQLYAAGHTLMQRMYACPVFQEIVRQKYKEEFLPLLEDMIENKIPAYRAEIAASAKMNEQRWHHEKLHVWEPVFEDYEAHADYVSDFLIQRREYLGIEWCAEQKVTVDYVSYAPVQKLGFYTLEKGEKVGELPVLECEGYRFEGWYDSVTDLPYDSEEALTESKTYVAKWTQTASEGLIQRLKAKAEDFAERQNWTIEKLINYALTGGLALIFGIALLAFFLGGLIKRRKRGERRK